VLIITIIQLVIALLLVSVVMLQSRGTESGVAFGGGSRSYRSKKGLERVLFYATIFLAAGFACISILSVLL
jgi:protein translocase SecG subunit